MRQSYMGATLLTHRGWAPPHYRSRNHLYTQGNLWIDFLLLRIGCSMVESASSKNHLIRTQSYLNNLCQMWTLVNLQWQSHWQVQALEDLQPPWKSLAIFSWSPLINYIRNAFPCPWEHTPSEVAKSPRLPTLGWGLPSRIAAISWS